MEGQLAASTGFTSLTGITETFQLIREVVRDELVNDIKGRLSISPDLARIDFIVFSGDAALNGKAERV